MSLHEECGVFGIFAPERTDAASLVYCGLYAIQHRGQESCGIVVNDDGLFYSHKDIGLVGDVFEKYGLFNFPKGNMAVGHVRYGTTGASDRKNCQPIEVNHQKGRMAIAHNGNLSNSFELRNKLELGGAIFHTTSDTETIAYIITKERLKSPSIEEAVSRSMDIIDGAYSLIVMSPAKMIACRDPYGFRPLCYGKTSDGTYVIASESCALTAVGAEFIRDLLPGEILVFTKNNFRFTMLATLAYLNLPNVNYTYSLVFLIVPFYIYLQEEVFTEGEKNKENKVLITISAISVSYLTCVFMLSVSLLVLGIVMYI